MRRGTTTTRTPTRRTSEGAPPLVEERTGGKISRSPLRGRTWRRATPPPLFCILCVTPGSEGRASPPFGPRRPPPRPQTPRPRAQLPAQTCVTFSNEENGAPPRAEPPKLPQRRASFALVARPAAPRLRGGESGCTLASTFSCNPSSTVKFHCNSVALT